MKFTIIPASFAQILLSVLRIAVGLTFLEHGTGKLLNFPPIQAMTAKMLGTGLFYFTGVFELVGGLLILIGLFTRPVAFVLSGFMAAGYFLAHLPQNFFPAMNGGDAAILFCFAFLYLAAAGPGPLSVDRA